MLARLLGKVMLVSPVQLLKAPGATLIIPSGITRLDGIPASTYI